MRVVSEKIQQEAAEKLSSSLEKMEGVESTVDVRTSGTQNRPIVTAIVSPENWRKVAEELKNSGKPDEIAKKISLGKMNKFKEENALLTQAWVMEPKKKVQDIIKELSIADLKIKEFFRIKIGE